MLLYALNDAVVKIMVPYGLSLHTHHPSTYWDLTVFLWGGASRRCSVCNIQSRLRWCVTVLVSQRMRSRDNTTTPYPQLGITWEWACSPTLRRLLWGEVSLYRPLIWGSFGVGRIYIGAFLKHPLWQDAPWRLAINDKWWSVLHSHSGRRPHGPLTPSHPPNGENMKAWDWNFNGNRYPNNRSHSWVIRKSISLMERSIVDGGNGEKCHCP